MTADADLILLAALGHAERGLFVDKEWRRRWTQVCEDRAQLLAKVQPPIVRLPAGSRVPTADGGGTLWIGELDQLTSVIEHRSGWESVVFEPSRLACLDRLRLARRTLVAARPIASGRIAQTADIRSVVGGTGVCASLIDSVVGARLCYSVAAGEPITFGLIDGSDDPDRTAFDGAVRASDD